MNILTLCVIGRNNKIMVETRSKMSNKQKILVCSTLKRKKECFLRVLRKILAMKMSVKNIKMINTHLKAKAGIL